MQKLKMFSMVALLIGATFVLSGCSAADTSNTGSTSQIEQNLTEKNQTTLLKNQPPPKLDWSLERENLIKRTNLWNDANKISYIYLISYGKVMSFYTIKGKVSSVNSQLTNTEQIKTPSDYTQTGWAVTLPSPSEDGSYGTNGDAVFFFTTEGAYVEWRGDYMLADQPLKMATQPELVRQIQ